jgi:glycolate oxidase
VKIPNEFLDKLSAVIDDDCVLLDSGSLEPYSHDETPDLQAYPDIVVKPENNEQVEKIVRLCYEYNIPITPRGAGTGVAGGSVPVVGGLVLSMERIDKIIETFEAK